MVHQKTRTATLVTLAMLLQVLMVLQLWSWRFDYAIPQINLLGPFGLAAWPTFCNGSLCCCPCRCWWSWQGWPWIVTQYRKRWRSPCMWSDWICIGISTNKSLAVVCLTNRVCFSRSHIYYNNNSLIILLFAIQLPAKTAVNTMPSTTDLEAQQQQHENFVMYELWIKKWNLACYFVN